MKKEKRQVSFTSLKNGFEMIKILTNPKGLNQEIFKYFFTVTQNYSAKVLAYKQENSRQLGLLDKAMHPAPNALPPWTTELSCNSLCLLPIETYIIPMWTKNGIQVNVVDS
ncbi:hypothetical protein BpHYR1_049003 [Brachionus plicatilis]|uniref:Uncharacterized protein n=1 Tax=Brachionus plicatilis TaxID=10195 RepID=A0A3M7T6Q5_BRAPC|nr:hypothetical protein BpHYR1_049003 [Brachionus plicatilis]